MRARQDRHGGLDLDDRPDETVLDNWMRSQMRLS